MMSRCAGEVDDVLHEVELDGRRRRVVREGEEQHPRTGLRSLVGLCEVRDEVLVVPHRDLEHARPGEHRRVDVDRVARRRDERGVAGLDERPHQVDEPLLRAHRRDDLRLGIELRRRTGGGRGRRRRSAASGSPSTGSSDGCVAWRRPPRASRPRPRARADRGCRSRGRRRPHLPGAARASGRGSRRRRTGEGRRCDGRSAASRHRARAPGRARRFPGRHGQLRPASRVPSLASTEGGRSLSICVGERRDRGATPVGRGTTVERLRCRRS